MRKSIWMDVSVKESYADCDGWIDADISFQECY